jgi:hypothetical protein
MNRRQALAATAALLGTAVVGGQAFLSGCTNKAPAVNKFDDNVILLLDEFGETILPTTASSPGAKAAKVGQFMSAIVTDCYSEKEQKLFFEGVNTVARESKNRFGQEFTTLTPTQKTELLTAFDTEARNSKNAEEHFFTMLHQLTLWGYFTSEPGVTKALRYLPVPGRYEGCIDYNGEPPWA